jgi:hypothetical protein
VSEWAKGTVTNMSRTWSLPGPASCGLSNTARSDAADLVGAHHHGIDGLASAYRTGRVALEQQTFITCVRVQSTVAKLAAARRKMSSRTVGEIKDRQKGGRE